MNSENKQTAVTVTLTVRVLMACYFLVVDTATSGIVEAPSKNVTVPLGQSQLVEYYCLRKNPAWVFNGTPFESEWRDPYWEAQGVEFNNIRIEVGAIVVSNLSCRFPAIAKLNNTRISCAELFKMKGSFEQTHSHSQTVIFNVAGPPLTPRPRFHIVNATHIEIEWDKPYAHPEFDVQYYTLTIINLENSSRDVYNYTYETAYPIRHYLNNGGDIPKKCNYLQFDLTATNAAGTSDTGSIVGGFPIAPKPIPDDPDSLEYEVTFAQDFSPILHINFSLPGICDFFDAKYSVLIVDEDGLVIDRSIEETYNKDSPDYAQVTMRQNLQRGLLYTVEINVSTPANLTTTTFQFDTNLNIFSVWPVRVTSNVIEETTMNVVEEETTTNDVKEDRDDSENTVIISISAVAGFIAILIGMNIILIVALITRRKLKRCSQAHHGENETDEAVLRAAEAMIPNPIYMGNPIYEEIFDLTHMQHSLKNGAHFDEDHAAKCTDAVKGVNGCPLPAESKVISDKGATFSEDTYTIMNPAGTLSTQSSVQAHEEPSISYSLYKGNCSLQESCSQMETTLTDDNGVPCAASARAELKVKEEERYVKRAF